MDFLTDDTPTHRDLGSIFKTQYSLPHSPFSEVSGNQFTWTLSLTPIEKRQRSVGSAGHVRSHSPELKKTSKLTLLCSHVSLLSSKQPQSSRPETSRLIQDVFWACFHRQRTSSSSLCEGFFCKVLIIMGLLKPSELQCNSPDKKRMVCIPNLSLCLRCLQWVTSGGVRLDLQAPLISKILMLIACNIWTDL